ncbi:hypothetical protein E6O75_ATG02910 [Venturia nashicola]|uniref:Rhodopsin domain-containing protein n=1 Tax=Venturia nashicola TaxID=86259 RepID=A0A4Z1P8F1_9PEZI|nr:hypothetical protein E6O75_ATG02910 [Venturia nashicola]
MSGGVHPPIETVVAWSKIANPSNPSQTRGWELVVLVVILFSITIFTVVARLWARLKVQHNAGLDDIIVVVTMIPTTGLALAIALASRLYGHNRHVWDLSPSMTVNSRKITMVISALYVISTSLTKISILLFYRRMSDRVSKAFRFAVHACIVFVVAYMITFLTTLFLTCRPINAYWNQVYIPWALSHEEGVDYHCLNEPADLLAASAISIVQDFLVCGMPTLLFWKLKLPRRQKIALAAVFGIGFFLCITGILRVIYITNIFFHTYDTTWATEPVWVWTAVEAHLAIVCASAPALKVFFKQYLNVSSITGSWRDASRLRSFFRKGYEEKAGLATFGTSSTAAGDIELGKIKVVCEVDIDTEHKRIDSHDGSVLR